MNLFFSNIIFSLFAVFYWKICAGDKNTCEENEIVLYNLKFQAQWSKEVFPKQYPEWRPPAQWSKLIGISHDESYNVFRIGEPASQELKTFAETGKVIDFTKNQTNVESHIYDEFSSPAIKSGVGETEINFFVDGNHSMVSAVVKIIPSPDWFVGIDALDLCSESNWIDMVTIEASPIDAGTDNGFTFTAPNWKTDPQEQIYKITSKYPRHPANSFYYPKLEDLPPIATFKIQKKKVYRQVTKTLNEEQNNQLLSTSETFSTTEPTKITDAINNTIDQNIQNDLPFKKRKSQTHRVKCKMSEWSHWSECSSSCSTGISTRARKVLRGKKSRQCPHLTEEKVCLAESECSKNYFKW